ncbi:ankyrin-3 [Heracleum sosnowskyi]|uniref:Ankyrin-3 n=1 Tax=Heracleum sosnowskyi TaxID=360622 RepID=A0AAD8I4G2_9APIA|nr:ankyrin-3 [Heracleum sosnowskyi]
MSLKQIYPVVDYGAQVSQRLVDAAHSNHPKVAFDCLNDPFVDVNFIGTVVLRSRKTEILLHNDSAVEVCFEFEEFKTEVTALFLAAHAGNATFLRKLLSVGASVNQKLFRGYALTAAVREGHIGILEILLKGGASQSACEEALLEASYLGRARPAKLLMEASMIRPHVAVHALVTASCRGFVDFVETLIKCGVDASATARVLLQSSKPSLYANVDCNALVAAIVSRQAAVVQLLLKVGGAGIDTKVRVGAWSWDTATGEEFRVGAGLAEPYNALWCAVEYFESSGAIMRMLLQHSSHDVPHLGRTVFHHAILCGNARAMEVLLGCSANAEFSVKTTERTEFSPLHLAARLGSTNILQQLINAGCHLDSKSEAGETAIMICARYKRVECLKLLALAGADFGLLSSAGQCVRSIAESMQWITEFQHAVLEVIQAEKVPHSSNIDVFFPLTYVIQTNDTAALKKLLEKPVTDLDQQDRNGFSAAMVAAAGGHVEAFQLLVYAGADLMLLNKNGETAVSLSEDNCNRDEFGKVILEYALDRENQCSGGFHALHRAAHQGDIDSVGMLMSRGYDINIPDSDGYTPLMLAAKEGHGNICELLISFGARLDFENARHETALVLARRKGLGNQAEGILLDELARNLVLGGSSLKKYRKKGKRSSHRKLLRMIDTVGVLSWGKSSKRNVICRGAEVGPSSGFRWNRRKKYDADNPGIFRVITTKNKEFHFLCDGGTDMAELWVRGIRIVTREAIFGSKQGDAQ